MASLSGGAGITRGALVARILRRLGDEPFTDTHSNAPTSSGTSLTVASDATKRFQVGGWVDWIEDASLDVALITAVAATALTIRRAHRGATAASHLANAVFRYMGRFNPPIASEIIDQTIEGLWPDVYSVSSTLFTIADPPAIWYNLPAATEDILFVYYKPASQTPQDIQRLAYSWTGPNFIDTGLAGTGKGLRIPDVPVSSVTTSGEFIVIFKEKAALTTLTAQQIELVVHEACVGLLSTAFSSESKPERRSGLEGAPDHGSAIQFHAAQARDLRMKERARLRDYLPERSRRRWTGFAHHA